MFDKLNNLSLYIHVIMINQEKLSYRMEGIRCRISKCTLFIAIWLSSVAYSETLSLFLPYLPIIKNTPCNG